VHSEKPLKRQIRYSIAETYGQAITATSGKARISSNARSVMPLRKHTDNPFSRNHLHFLAVSDFVHSEKPLKRQIRYSIAETYGQAITATSGKARISSNARSVIPLRKHTDNPFSRNHLHFLAVSDTLPVLTQMHYMFDAACGSR
jgi:hypothetical protein